MGISLVVAVANGRQLSTATAHPLSCKFSKHLAVSAAKYREKGWAVTSTGEGRSTNPFWNF